MNTPPKESRRISKNPEEPFHIPSEAIECTYMCYLQISHRMRKGTECTKLLFTNNPCKNRKQSNQLKGGFKRH